MTDTEKKPPFLTFALLACQMAKTCFLDKIELSYRVGPIFALIHDADPKHCQISARDIVKAPQ